MTKFQVLGVAALALLMLAPDATAQRGGGAVRSGARERWSADSWAGSPERQPAPRSVPLPARPDPLVGGPGARPIPSQCGIPERSALGFQSSTAAGAGHRSTGGGDRPTGGDRTGGGAPGGEAVLQKNGKPVVGVTFPSDWKQATGDRYISAVSADGQAYAMIATLEGAADKPGGINRVKQGLLQYLQDIKYDDLTETKRGALVVTGTAKGKKAGVDVVFAAGVLDAGAGQIVGAAFVVDSRIEDYYKETIRQICQTIRVGDDFAAKK